MRQGEYGEQKPWEMRIAQLPKDEEAQLRFRRQWLRSTWVRFFSPPTMNYWQTPACCTTGETPNASQMRPEGRGCDQSFWHSALSGRSRKGRTARNSAASRREFIAWGATSTGGAHALKRAFRSRTLPAAPLRVGAGGPKRQTPPTGPLRACTCGIDGMGAVFEARRSLLPIWVWPSFSLPESLTHRGRGRFRGLGGLTWRQGTDTIKVLHGGRGFPCWKPGIRVFWLRPKDTRKYFEDGHVMRMLLVMVVAVAIASMAQARVWTTIYRCDEKTPLAVVDPNQPSVYRDIMVGTKLAIVVKSDSRRVLAGPAAIPVDEEILLPDGRGYDAKRRSYAGSCLPAAGKNAGAWDFLEMGVLGSWNSTTNAGIRVAGDWFIFDYQAEQVGSCSLKLYDYTDCQPGCACRDAFPDPCPIA